MKIISAPSIKLVPSTDVDSLIKEHLHLNDQRGYSEYRTIDGKKLMLFHGGEYGTIGIPIETAMTADIIICCFPKIVGLMYPELINKIYRPIRNINTVIVTQLVWQGESRTMTVEAEWN